MLRPPPSPSARTILLIPRCFETTGGFEILGALGLILPGFTGIRRNLTPIAAGCLTIIMIGAVISTAATMGIALALLPLVAGALDVVVLNGRRDWLSGVGARRHSATGIRR